jgi:hypothetical protein
MKIQLNPEEERLIRQAIQAGLIGKADDVVAVGLETIRRQLQSRAGSGSGLMLRTPQPHHPHCAQRKRAVAALTKYLRWRSAVP